jgi:hypothetical protein
MGAQSTEPQDRSKPNIDWLFHHRIVLRVQEMLRQIRRAGLLGVVRGKNQVKTTGTAVWGGGGVVQVGTFPFRPRLQLDSVVCP